MQTWEKKERKIGVENILVISLEKKKWKSSTIWREEDLFGMGNGEERAIRWVLNNSGETLPSNP